MAAAAETAGDGHGGHRKTGLSEEPGGLFEPDPTIAVVDALSHMKDEEAFKLPKRHAGDAGERLAAFGLFNRRLHAREHLQHPIVGDAVALPQAGLLGLVGRIAAARRTAATP